LVTAAVAALAAEAALAAVATALTWQGLSFLHDAATQTRPIPLSNCQCASVVVDNNAYATGHLDDGLTLRKVLLGK
jgi:hypothetical protein